LSGITQRNTTKRPCLIFLTSLLGKPVSTEDLDEVAALSGVMAYGDDYLEPNVRANCERIIPEIETVLPNDAADSFLFLKAHYRHQRQ
jgi:hypothetical protein